ncbi:hypothetical protein BGZ80_000653 [Entomortierella chlamydospora]|uniref:Uncharacterized protein n=1 Tax=Entomortierella chlamydospora TaxID=101097 RepID=A0A9P6N3J6_9FUNG|nr:hypothetical protein BGZ80_000653 [Entomortierella chlamydospora]
MDQYAMDLGMSRGQLTACQGTTTRVVPSAYLCPDIAINIETVKESATPSMSSVLILMLFNALSTMGKAVSNVIDDCLKSNTVKVRFKKTPVEIEDLYQPSRSLLVWVRNTD